MKLTWLKGVPQKDKGVMKARIMESHDVLTQLASILEADLETSYTQMAKEGAYQQPAWSEYQAHKLGEQACLRKLLELIDIEESE
jgi:hypothetical protein